MDASTDLPLDVSNGYAFWDRVFQSQVVGTSGGKRAGRYARSKHKGYLVFSGGPATANATCQAGQINFAITKSRSNRTKSTTPRSLW